MSLKPTPPSSTVVMRLLRSARRVPEERTSEGSGPAFERVRLRTDLRLSLGGNGSYGFERVAFQNEPGENACCIRGPLPRMWLLDVTPTTVNMACEQEQQQEQDQERSRSRGRSRSGSGRRSRNGSRSRSTSMSRSRSGSGSSVQAVYKQQPLIHRRHLIHADILFT